MSMTKKDFKAIAQALANVREQQITIEGKQAVDAVSELLDEYFEQSYIKYAGFKFLSKAGYFGE